MAPSSFVEPPTSPTAPLALFPPLAPTESRSRAPEFYGFVAWTCTYLLFVLYLIWTLLPDEAILWLGVDWYPNRLVLPLRARLWLRVGMATRFDQCTNVEPDREWALLVPAWLCVIVLLTYFTYFAMALRGTPSFHDLRTIIGASPFSFLLVCS